MSRRSYGMGTTPKAAQPARALPGTTCSTLAGYQAQSQWDRPTDTLRVFARKVNLTGRGFLWRVGPAVRVSTRGRSSARSPVRQRSRSRRWRSGGGSHGQP